MVCQDLPDYSRKVIIEYTGGFMGLEELATRLGFIAPFDLQGNVVMMEDFETEETEWGFTAVGGTTAAARQSRHKFSGNWAIELFVDNVAGAVADVHRHIYYPGAVKCGLFCRVKFDKNASIMRFGAEFWNGTHRFNPICEYNRVTTTLSIFDDTLSQVTVDAALEIARNDLIWVPWLIIFDLSTGLWDRIRFGDMEYDRSANVLVNGAVVRAKYGWLGVAALDVAGAGFTCYTDDIVLVRNVP